MFVQNEMLGSPRPRVLIVDDDAGIRHLYGAFLSRDGRVQIVGEAANGQHAVELAAECMPDIILLDLDMPSMNGADALPLLRECAPDALIIVVAGDVAGREEELLKLGADNCLPKTGDRWLGLAPELFSIWEEFSGQRESA